MLGGQASITEGQSLGKHPHQKDRRFAHPDHWSALLEIGDFVVSGRVSGKLALLYRVPHPVTGFHFLDIVSVEGPLRYHQFREDWTEPVFQVTALAAASNVPTFTFKANGSSYRDSLELCRLFQSVHQDLSLPDGSKAYNDGTEWREGYCSASDESAAMRLLCKFVDAGLGRAIRFRRHGEVLETDLDHPEYLLKMTYTSRDRVWALRLSALAIIGMGVLGPLGFGVHSMSDALAVLAYFGVFVPLLYIAYRHWKYQSMTITNDGVSATNIFRRRRDIAWAEIKGVTYSRSLQRVSLLPENGRRISVDRSLCHFREFWTILGERVSGHVHLPLIEGIA